MISDINSKYLKKEREKNSNFPQGWLKDESIETHSPAICLEGWVGILNMNT